jgi:hypothetical protein
MTHVALQWTVEKHLHVVKPYIRYIAASSSTQALCLLKINCSRSMFGPSFPYIPTDLTEALHFMTLTVVLNTWRLVALANFGIMVFKWICQLWNHLVEFHVILRAAPYNDVHAAGIVVLLFQKCVDTLLFLKLIVRRTECRRARHSNSTVADKIQCKQCE